MTQIDSALEYLNDLGRGAKFIALKFDDIFNSLQTCAIRKGYSNEILKELVSLWLKINIPVTKWSSLGYCLIPEGKISDEIVTMVLNWIISNHKDESSFKVVSVLNWLTGLLDHNLVNRDVLDLYYEFFFSFLDNDKYLIPASKLVYNFTKSSDVSRSKVLNILSLKDVKRSSRHHNCLMVVLSLFKSYRPECVPENVPIVSVNVAFSKINKLWIERLEQAKIRSNVQENLSIQNRLTWWTGETGGIVLKKQKMSCLVPDLEHLQLGAVIYTKNGPQKKCLDFTSTHSLMAYHFRHPIEIPANILSLLVNDAGLHILKFSDPESQARFSQTLYHTLHNNFLKTETSLSYNQKRHFLKRISSLQIRLMQAIPVVSRFLSQYICTWNGLDFFDEIVELLEWISFESFDELYDCVLEHIESLILTSDTIYRFALLDMLKKMYINIHNVVNTKHKLVFIKLPGRVDLLETSTNFCSFIDELCEKSLNTLPDNEILRHSFLNIYETIAEVQLNCDLPLWTVVPMSLAYSILCSYNVFNINRILGLFLKYRLIYDKIKSSHGKDHIKFQIMLAESYSTDFVNCLWYGKSISWRKHGLLLSKLPEKLLHNLESNLNEFDQLLDIKHHIAFLIYYIGNLPDMIDMDFDKDVFLEAISPAFFNIPKFINTVISQTEKMID